ncbi:MAG: hypothetical protein HZC49_10400 [Nitrospirae bacterium]|nr:hypothetical protein [Nitrospirota bacterium]
MDLIVIAISEDVIVVRHCGIISIESLIVKCRLKFLPESVRINDDACVTAYKVNVDNNITTMPYIVFLIFIPADPLIVEKDIASIEQYLCQNQVYI